MVKGVIMVKKIISAILISSILSSCAPTIHTWTEGLPPDQYQLSEREKKEVFKKFAISDINSYDTIPTFTSLDDPETHYSLDSFSAVLDNISPITQDYIYEAEQYDFYCELAGWGLAASCIALGVAASQYNGNSNSGVITASGITFSTFLITESILQYLKEQNYRQVRKEYLKELNNYLYLDTKSHRD